MNARTAPPVDHPLVNADIVVRSARTVIVTEAKVAYNGVVDVGLAQTTVALLVPTVATVLVESVRSATLRWNAWRRRQVSALPRFRASSGVGRRTSTRGPS